MEELDKTSKKFDLTFHGTNFSAEKLKENIYLDVNILAEKDVISKSGKYKEQLSPYSLAYVVTDVDGLEYILGKMDKLLEAGVEEIELNEDTKSPFKINKVNFLNDILKWNWRRKAQKD